MTKKIQHKGAMIADQTQKKLILDLFNAGREVFDEFDLRYVSAWNLKQLEDLIDDMKDAFGIVPKISEYKHDDGSVAAAHYQDHVWSDDPRAWKYKS
jgi:predicted AAA+ superfamily ATPase